MIEECAMWELVGPRNPSVWLILRGVSSLLASLLGLDWAGRFLFDDLQQCPVYPSLEEPLVSLHTPRYLYIH